MEPGAGCGGQPAPLRIIRLRKARLRGLEEGGAVRLGRGRARGGALGHPARRAHCQPVISRRPGELLRKRLQPERQPVEIQHVKVAAAGKAFPVRGRAGIAVQPRSLGAAAAAALRADIALPLSVPRQKRGFPFVNRLDHRFIHEYLLGITT